MRRGWRSGATVPLCPVMATGRNECIRVTAARRCGCRPPWCGAGGAVIQGCRPAPLPDTLGGKWGNDKAKAKAVAVALALALVQGMAMTCLPVTGSRVRVGDGAVVWATEHSEACAVDGEAAPPCRYALWPSQVAMSAFASLRRGGVDVAHHGVVRVAPSFKVAGATAGHTWWEMGNDKPKAQAIALVQGMTCLPTRTQPQGTRAKPKARTPPNESRLRFSHRQLNGESTHSGSAHTSGPGTVLAFSPSKRRDNSVDACIRDLNT